MIKLLCWFIIIIFHVRKVVGACSRLVHNKCIVCRFPLFQKCILSKVYHQARRIMITSEIYPNSVGTCDESQYLGKIGYANHIIQAWNDGAIDGVVIDEFHEGLFWFFEMFKFDYLWRRNNLIRIIYFCMISICIHSIRKFISYPLPGRELAQVASS